MDGAPPDWTLPWEVPFSSPSTAQAVPCPVSIAEVQGNWRRASMSGVAFADIGGANFRGPATSIATPARGMQDRTARDVGRLPSA